MLLTSNTTCTKIRLIGAEILPVKAGQSHSVTFADRHKHTDRHTVGQANRQIDRQTSYTHTDRHTERHTDREAYGRKQPNAHTDTHTNRHTHTNRQLHTHRQIKNVGATVFHTMTINNVCHLVI